ncbi:MAG: hypothetical protein V1754_03050 [Pseudomonadota bacterium]
MKNKCSTLFRSPIRTDRLRSIDGGFAFIPHRFLRDGFLASLSQDEALLYFFLCLTADRHGISFYLHESICSLLSLEFGQVLVARDALIAKDLLAFDGRRFQVLSLPAHPVEIFSPSLCTDEDFETRDPATIRKLIQASLGSKTQGR